MKAEGGVFVGWSPGRVDEEALATWAVERGRTRA